MDKPIMGYTKLYSSIITSTIWQESLPTKVVWITLLALSDAVGMVEGSIPGIARLAGVTIPECEEALAVLKKPDPYSRTKEHEGRRIKEVEGGWVVLNREKYREKEDSRAEYWRQYREKRGATVAQQESCCAPQNRTQEKEEEKKKEETKEEEEEGKEKEQSPRGDYEFRDWGSFAYFWDAYPRKVGKADALKAWKKIKKADALLPQMLDTIAAWRDSESWTKEGRKYCPHPAKWLKDGRWDDEPPAYEPDEFERAGLSRPMTEAEGRALLGLPPIDESK